MSVPSDPRALVFDLDGTLYHQGPLRRAMLQELAWTPVTRGPRAASALLRGLSCFRKEREALRSLGQPEAALEQLQYERPAELLGRDPVELRAAVEEWIHQRPLRHLSGLRRTGARECLRQARERGLAIGVFSDYPVDEKLAALGLADLVDVTLCSTDAEVNAFKPHPAGFLAAAARLGVEPGEALYIGDRAEVDGAGARAAGMGPVLISEAPADDGLTYIGSLEEVWSGFSRG